MSAIKRQEIYVLKSTALFAQSARLIFSKKYGKIGKGFIHVSHLKPTSQKSKEYFIGPINDLIPVCLNCHAMIHKKEPPYTPCKIKKFMEGAKPKLATKRCPPR